MTDAMPPMRIAQVTSALREPLGGAEKYCLAVSRWLASRGHEVTILTATASSSVVKQLAADGIPVHQSGPWRPYPGDQKGPSGLAKLLFHGLDVVQAVRTFDRTFGVDSREFDVIHVHRFQGLGLGVLRAVGAPVVATVHDHALVDTRTEGSRAGISPASLGVAQRMRAGVAGRAVRGVSKFIFPTHRILDRHQALGLHIRPEQAVVIPHGWALPLPTVERGPEDLFTFLFLGKLNTNKGMHLILEAWGAGIEGSRIIVGGAGELERQCRAMHGSRNFEFRGWLTDEDRAQALAEADCLLMPSTWEECFPLVIAESILARVPVITTKIASPTLVTDGLNGLVVAAEANALRAAMTEIASDPALANSLRRGTDSLAGELDLDTHGSRLVSVYTATIRGQEGS